MDIAIIDYNAGNIRSVDFALQRLGVNAEITGDKEKIASANKVIFPGVGEASSAMRHLKKEGLDQLIRELEQPVLGICIGLQLLCSHSEEGDVDCIGIFDEKVKLFDHSDNPFLKIPEMGWNNIHDLKSPLFKGVEENDYVYFVHSYYAEIGSQTIATGDYINHFSAALHKDNFYATQFHPEKSGPVGAKVLKNFVEL